jgi:hypothetical protein
LKIQAGINNEEAIALVKIEDGIEARTDGFGTHPMLNDKLVLDQEEKQVLVLENQKHVVNTSKHMKCKDK